jgi:hypothetical protein
MTGLTRDSKNLILLERPGQRPPVIIVSGLRDIVGHVDYRLGGE